MNPAYPEPPRGRVERRFHALVVIHLPLRSDVIERIVGIAASVVPEGCALVTSDDGDTFRVGYWLEVEL